MFIEPNGTEARFMYRINRAGEVSHCSAVCTNYVAPLSRAGPEHSRSSALPSSPWCSQLLQGGDEPPVCVPGLPKAPGDLKLAGCGEHPGWRPLVRRDDCQSLYTLASTPCSLNSRENQPKIIITITITLLGKQFWRAATCLLPRARNAW